MLDLLELQKVFNQTNSFTKYSNGIVFNSNLTFADDGESFSFEFAEFDNKIAISDMGITYKKLLDKDLDISKEEDLIKYRNKVLNTFNVQINTNNELFVIARSIEECPSALGNLEQCIVLLNYLDLQFED